jgi:hypothetical protein
VGGQDGERITKKGAEKDALATCRMNGGGEGCKILLTFKDQCGVLALGMAPDGSGLLFAEKAATAEAAAKRTLESCGKRAQICQALKSICVSKEYAPNYMDMR